jgi:glycosyltransferase involved in cell wall biosynthesis
MKVLYVDYSVGFGGAVKSLALTLSGLADIDVTIMTSQSDKVSAEWFSGFRVIPFRRFVNYRTKEIANARLTYAPVRWMATKAISVADAFVERISERRILRELSNGKYDLVHLNNGFLPREAFSAASRLGIPCIVHLRHFQNKLSILETIPPGAVARVIAVSDAVAAGIQHIAIGANNIVRIHDPVDFHAMESAAGHRGRLRIDHGVLQSDILVGIFGRVIPWKGQLEFVAAMLSAMAQTANLRAIIIGDEGDGDSGYFRDVQRLANDSVFADRFVFAGYRKNVEQYYHACDIVVHASTEPEPFGMVVPEGMAAGRAVIAVAEGGPCEVITDRVDGLLVPPRNVEALSDAIRQLATNGSMRSQMGRAAYQAVRRNLGVSTNADRVRAVYDQILTERRTCR